MPRIPDYLLDCVVYLYPSEAAALDGERMGGSGFLFGARIPGSDRNLLYVVTNKHVINSASMIVRLNTEDGAIDIVSLDGAAWQRHPDGDDLAICAIGLDQKFHKFSFLRQGSNILGNDVLDILDIGVGDDVFVVGRFVNREGKQKNTPSVRFGNIAQMPGEPIIDENGFEQESYLIEGRSIPGYSGSPVFITIEKTPEDLVLSSGVRFKTRTRKYPIQFDMGPLLLGIDFCHIHSKDKIYSALTRKPVSDDWYVKSNTGMMGVIPVSRLLDMMETPEVKHAVAKAEQELKKLAAVSLDVAPEGPRANDENPNHRGDFNRLMRKAAKTAPDKGK